MRYETTYSELKRLGFKYQIRTDRCNIEVSDNEEFLIDIDEVGKRITISVLTAPGTWEPIDEYKDARYNMVAPVIKRELRYNKKSYDMELRV